MKYIDPYDEGDGYVPRSTGITRGHSMTDLQEAASSAGRRSRQWRYGDGELHDPNVGYDDMVDRGNVPLGRENLPERGGGSPYEGETRRMPDRGEASIYQPYGNTQTQYQVDPSQRPSMTDYGVMGLTKRLMAEVQGGRMTMEDANSQVEAYLSDQRAQRTQQMTSAAQASLGRYNQTAQQSYNPFVPSAQQGYPPMRPPMEIPNTASPATPMSLADTFSPAAIAAQRAQREAENKPGANAIFKPQPVTGGRPDNVADNVANDVIARAAIASARGDANADDLLTQAATLAWQREAALNGNERGDVRAPQDYIESWKGQVRAGEAGSPFADMFGRATNVARQSFAAEEAQRREAASAQERRMIEAERAQRAQRQPPPYVGNGTPPYMGNAPMGGGEYGVSRGPTPGYTAYPTARGGESSESQYGTRRLNSSVAEQAYDDDLITRVMNGVRNPSSSASLPTASGPLPAYLQGRQPRAGLQSGKDDPGDQAAQVWSSARALGGDEFADAVGGLIVAEGGLTGATGDTHLDPRGSHGPFQFYAKGELQPFRQAMSKKYGREISEQEAMQLARNVDEVTAYYLPKLYGAYQDAKKKGFTGDDLTVGLAAGAFDESGAGHNRGITSDPNKFYPIYRNGLKNFRSGTFAQSGSIAALANQGR